MNASINNADLDADDLKALVGSRICHDLVSPLGAISNGVELLNMAGTEQPPEIALISQSVQSANARIRFFRVAFGGAGVGTMFAPGDAVAILTDVYDGTRTRVEWQVSGDAARAEVKLAFLLTQCIDSALPKGGEIVIAKLGDGWKVRGTGERLRIDPALWARLDASGDHSGISASDVHFALVAPAAAQIGRAVTCRSDETSITLSF